MDSRLYRIGGGRLVRLRYSDAPKVARAILDGMSGDAQVLTGEVHGSSFVQFVRHGSYNVVIRGDEWSKIFPFIRYSTPTYTPVYPPSNRPARVASPQPNRLREVPPEKPDGGLRSFLEHKPYNEYQQTQKLLTTVSLGVAPEGGVPPSLDPQPTDLDGSLRGRELYNRLVYVLQELFPTDFPETEV